MINTSVPITNMEHHYLVTENIPTVEALHSELPVIRDTDSHFLFTARKQWASVWLLGKGL